MIRGLFLAAVVPALFAAGTPYAPLWLYQGQWKGTMQTGDSVPAAIDLVNTCGRIGTFGPVLLYVSAGPGRYYTQVIQPEGSAAGRGEFQFEQSESSDGEHWVIKMSGDNARVSKGAH